MDEDNDSQKYYKSKMRTPCDFHEKTFTVFIRAIVQRSQLNTTNSNENVLLFIGLITCHTDNNFNLV